MDAAFSIPALVPAAAALPSCVRRPGWPSTACWLVGRAAKAANSALGDVWGGEEDGTMAATATVEKGRMG